MNAWMESGDRTSKRCVCLCVKVGRLAAGDHGTVESIVYIAESGLEPFPSIALQTFCTRCTRVTVQSAHSLVVLYQRSPRGPTAIPYQRCRDVYRRVWCVSPEKGSAKRNL